MGNDPECLWTKYPEPEMPKATNAGIWYGNKSRLARHYAGLLLKAKISGAPERDLRFLEDRLDSARYVGD